MSTRARILAEQLARETDTHRLIELADLLIKALDEEFARLTNHVTK